MAKENWSALAECLNMSGDIFFPPVGRNYREAMIVCYRCTVRTECLDMALRSDMQHGYVGGMSPQQRRAEQELRRIR